MTESEARELLKRDRSARLVLRSLISEYDRSVKLLAMCQERGLVHAAERQAGEIAGLRVSIAVFTGVYTLPVGHDNSGVEGWLPALRRIAA